MAVNLRIAGAIVAGLILAGCAATSRDRVAAADKSAAVAKDSACPNGTGSRIPGGSNSASVCRSYTDDDLTRTGYLSVGDALAHLDPSVSVSH
jgi:hypothetical protein